MRTSGSAAAASGTAAPWKPMKSDSAVRNSPVLPDTGTRRSPMARRSPAMLQARARSLGTPSVAGREYHVSDGGSLL